MKIGDGITPLSELRETSYDAILQLIPPSAQIVLIGEGTHGTEEFFRIRSELTQCLVRRRGFDAILCEGDVQPFFELNRFVTEGNGGVAAAAADGTHSEAEVEDRANIRSMLSGLFAGRFPEWMWDNMPMADMICWLKSYNCNNPRAHASPVQVLGMDIQSPFDSMDYVMKTLLKKGEDELSMEVGKLYATLLKYRNNMRAYGNDVYGSKVASQENSVRKALDVLLQKYHESGRCGTASVQEIETWHRVIENGHAIVASEAYHRQRIYPGHTATWNLRTESWVGTILRCRDFVDQLSSDDTCEAANTKLVIWAHNSHVGDMRSTGFASLGQINLGQRCRERFGGHNVFLVGLTTYRGTVRAAQADRQGNCYDGPGEVHELNRALGASHESALHSIASEIKSFTGVDSFGLDLSRNIADSDESFNCEREERFVGSCYRPERELMAHYVKCNLTTQFDYLIHVDNSSAITVS